MVDMWQVEIHARREWHSSRRGFSGAAYPKQIQVVLCDGVMQSVVSFCLWVSQRWLDL